MDARTLSMKTIFGQDRRLEVPLYQRPYVWTRKKQLEPLWDDIRALAEKLATGEVPRAHFLGAVVLDQVHQPMGQLERRQIIDGQQRLTTIQVFAEALCDVCGQIGLEKFHKALLKLTRNDDPMSDDPDEAFKVWPTNVDREPFRAVMSVGSPQQLRDTGNDKAIGLCESPIADAYVFFYESISQWIKESDDTAQSRVEGLFAALRDYVRMVVIDLDQKDDPQLIFETLNARGTPLLPADLVKNFLFHRALQNGHSPDTLYQKYWLPFDKDAAYWREEIGRGHAKRARIDQYLQHYLTWQIADEIPVGHLYTGFREHFSSAASDGIAVETLASLSGSARIYREFGTLAPDTKAGRFFRRLETMDVTTAYPFLLELFSVCPADSDLVRTIVGDVESFLVRRLVCGLNTRGYGRMFIDLLSAFRKAKGANSVRQFLLASDVESLRWPDDGEFRQAWLDQPAYLYHLRSRVRMILEAVELEIRSEKGEKVGLHEKLTIEHLLPVAWKAHYPLSSGGDVEQAGAARDRTIHTFGNLTLLTQKLNSEISNGPWQAKVGAIYANTLLRMNIELKDRWMSEPWDELGIQTRGAALLERALRVWPRPKST